MGCGSSLSESEVMHPDRNSSIQIREVSRDCQKGGKQGQHKGNDSALVEIKTEKSIVNADKMGENSVKSEEQEMAVDSNLFSNQIFLFGESALERKVVKCNLAKNPPSFETLLARSNNPAPIKYQPTEIILEESEEFFSSHLFCGKSHPPYNFMFATYIRNGLIFLCGGVNFKFDHVSSEAFVYNPKEQMEIMPTPSKNSCKRRVGNNLMGTKFQKLPYMKQKRYSCMGVHYRAGRLSYVYVFGGRSENDMLINKCEVYSFQEKKWMQIPSMSEPRSTGFALIVNKKIYVFGGYTGEGKRSKKIERYIPSCQSWETVPFKLHRGLETGLLLPIPKSHNELLLLGGSVELGSLKSVIRINFEKETYAWDSDMKKQRLLQKGIMVQQQNAVYTFGGDFDDLLEKYSFKDKSWKSIGNASFSDFISPDDINSFAMAQETIELSYQDQYEAEKPQQNNEKSAGNSTFVFGSDDYPCIFELLTDKWVLKKKTVPLTLRLRCHMSSIKIKEGKYFIAGGIDSYGEKSSRAAYIYYSKSNKAIEIAKMKQKKHSFAVCQLNGFIYVFGGRSKDGKYSTILSAAERYNIADDEWEQLPDLSRQRQGAQALCIGNNQILIIGGNDGIQVNQIQIFDAKEKSFFRLKNQVPIPLQIKAIYNMEISDPKELCQNSELNLEQQFDFLENSEDENEGEVKPVKQEVPREQSVTVASRWIKLLVINYNSYYKQHKSLQLAVELEGEQRIKQLAEKSQKLAPHLLTFPVPALRPTKALEESPDVDDPCVNVLPEASWLYLISPKGVFKWRAAKGPKQNGQMRIQTQILINQMHLLSMPMQKFSIS